MFLEVFLGFLGVNGVFFVGLLDQVLLGRCASWRGLLVGLGGFLRIKKWSGRYSSDLPIKVTQQAVFVFKRG